MSLTNRAFERLEHVTMLRLQSATPQGGFLDVILLLSGPLAAGKSSVANALEIEHRFRRIRSGAYLLELAGRRGVPADRKGLQTLGDALDEDTGYLWLVADIARPTIHAQPWIRRWLVDCVRKPEQVAHFRAAFGDRAYHAHLTAGEAVLMQRYQDRLRQGGEYLGNTPYEAAIQHPNEVAARGLASLADVTISTEHSTPSLVASRLATYSPE